MADTGGSKKVGIPAWQRVEADTKQSTDAQQKSQTRPEATIVGKSPVEEPREEQQEGHEGAATVAADEESTVEQVRKFLSEPAVKSAPLEKKRAFLESKGIDNAIIDKVLENHTSEFAAGTTKDTFSVADFQQSRPQSKPSQQIQRDVPPVVTYPEFLVQPQQPPPLVTVDRLLNVAYAAGAVGTVFYGLTKYLIGPMADNLTEARHDFAQHTQAKLDKMNDGLSNVVSKVPTSTKSTTGDFALEDDTESVASDPTELFHRDTGTQTLPEDIRRPSFDSSLDGTIATIKSTAEKHEDRLNIMNSHLQEMLSGAHLNANSNDDVQSSVTELRDYLNQMLYLPPAQMENGVWHTASTMDKKKDDSISAFRAEIRSVKGVLLSAKRFPPTGGPAVRVGG